MHKVYRKNRVLGGVWQYTALAAMQDLRALLARRNTSVTPYYKSIAPQQRLLTLPCLLCHERLTDTASGFCTTCTDALPWHSAGCPICAATSTSTQQPCGACQKNPPPFKTTQAIFRYSKPIDRIIQRLKYHRQLHLLRLLSDIMAKHLHATKAHRQIDLIVPIPLHNARLRARGFNQALEIAKPIARRLNISLDDNLCRRIRNTKSQAALKYSTRHKNMRDAFATTHKLKGLRIAIIDDVMTSGSTLRAAAHCLRQAGAQEIRAWVIART